MPWILSHLAKIVLDSRFAECDNQDMSNTLPPRPACEACKAHSTGECDEHFESFGRSVYGDDEDDGEVVYPVPQVVVEGVRRFA